MQIEITSGSLEEIKRAKEISEWELPKAKNIILFGMDFGNTIGKYSKNISNKTLKRKKLRFGKKLLEWLALRSKSNLYTTSKPIYGFKKISFSDLEEILNY